MAEINHEIGLDNILAGMRPGTLSERSESDEKSIVQNVEYTDAK